MRPCSSGERYYLDIQSVFTKVGSSVCPELERDWKAKCPQWQENPGDWTIMSFTQRVETTPCLSEQPCVNIRLYDTLWLWDRTSHAERKPCRLITHTTLTWTQRPPGPEDSVSPKYFPEKLQRTSTVQLTQRLFFVAGAGLHALWGTSLSVSIFSRPPPTQAPSQLGTALPCPTSPTRGSPWRAAGAAEFWKRRSFLLLSCNWFSLHSTERFLCCNDGV